MRLQPIGAISSSAPINRQKSAKNINPLNVISKTNTVSFQGRADHIIFYGAEFPDYNKKGGVANVMGYYEKLPGVETVIVQPYYIGQKDYNIRGEYTGRVRPWQFSASCPYEGLRGQYFYVKFDTDKKNINTEISSSNLDKNIEGKNIIILKKITDKTVKYGKQNEQTIALFKAMQAVPIKDSTGKIVDYRIEELPKHPETGKPRNHFFVFTKGTAEFNEPYADGSYSSDKEVNPEAFSKYKPHPYPENNRAFVEFKNDICNETITSDGSKFDAGTVVCSDSQTAYTISFMRDEAIKGTPGFSPEEITAAYGIHNARSGYTGECGGLDMALNLGLTEDEIITMKKDPEYIAAEENGTLDSYFEKYIPELRDALGSFNPTMIALKLREKGYMNGLFTVSAGYAYDIAYNTNMPTSFRKDWKVLYDNGEAVGIMNPFADPGFHIFKGVTGMDGYLEAGVNSAKEKLAQYGGEFAQLAGELHPFAKVDETKFPKNGDKYTVTEEAYDHYLEIKNINKKEFLNRLTSKFDVLKDKDKDLYNTLIAGRPNWNVNLIGRIDENLLTPENIGNLKVYVSWGRLDEQKSLDIVMNSFDMYCTSHPEEAKNCILILGGEAPGTDYSKKILAQAEKMANKHSGRLVFMEAFAPGKILASVAEMALLPSREAPCELTDLETMQFLTMLTVTNTQGMADKNFDPDIDKEKDIATSFKTASGYYLSKEDIANFKEQGIGEQWAKEYGKFIDEVTTEKNNRKASAYESEWGKDEPIEYYIGANPEHQKKLNQLIDKYRSLILAAGVAACIGREAVITKAQKIKMAENELNLKTGWENNQQLTKSEQSSAEMYRSIFHTKAKDIKNYSESFLHKLREHLKTIQPPKNEIESVVKKKGFLGKYGSVIGWSAASAILVGSSVYAIMSNRNDNNTTPFKRKHPGGNIHKPQPKHKMNINA